MKEFKVKLLGVAYHKGGTILIREITNIRNAGNGWYRLHENCEITIHDNVTLEIQSNYHEHVVYTLIIGHRFASNITDKEAIKRNIQFEADDLVEDTISFFGLFKKTTRYLNEGTYFVGEPRQKRMTNIFRNNWELDLNNE